MKRTLTLAVAIAVIGGFALVAITGSAAASIVEYPTDGEVAEVADVTDDDVIDQTIGDQTATQEIETGDATTESTIEQANLNLQEGTATAGDAVALSDGGTTAGVAGIFGDDGGAASIAELDQDQAVTQENVANVDQVADTSVDATQEVEQSPTQDALVLTDDLNND